LVAVKRWSITLPRIARRSRFKYDDGGFLIRACPMLDAAWHDAILASLESNNPVAELDAHLATPDQEHLVLIFVAVPGELALKLDELRLLPFNSATILGRQCSDIIENFSSIEAAIMRPCYQHHVRNTVIFWRQRF
jgi:hypothetical protein